MEKIDRTNKISSEEIIIEKLKREHDLSMFSSYEKDLVEFIKEDALENQELNLSLTFLLRYKEDIVGYITLLTDRIDLKGDIKEKFIDKEIYYKSLPAIKIGRLCVDDKYLRKGLGREMMKFAVKKAEEINYDKAGCRFITLDAKRNKDKNKDPLEFYKKLGFEVVKEREKTTYMCLDLRDFKL